MSDLKKEISKNIQLVFDNEKSFIKKFGENKYIESVYSFYMGSSSHRVEFEFESGATVDRKINASSFDIWKSNLENKE